VDSSIGEFIPMMLPLITYAKLSQIVEIFDVKMVNAGLQILSNLIS